MKWFHDRWWRVQYRVPTWECRVPTRHMQYRTLYWINCLITFIFLPIQAKQKARIKHTDFRKAAIKWVKMLRFWRWKLFSGPKNGVVSEFRIDRAVRRRSLARSPFRADTRPICAQKCRKTGSRAILDHEFGFSGVSLPRKLILSPRNELFRGFYGRFLRKNRQKNGHELRGPEFQKKQAKTGCFRQLIQ